MSSGRSAGDAKAHRTIHKENNFSWWLSLCAVTVCGSVERLSAYAVFRTDRTHGRERCVGRWVHVRHDGFLP